MNADTTSIPHASKAMSRLNARPHIGKRVRPALPAGPRMPSALQAIGWAWRSLPFMERCQRRYGDIFTLRVRHGGTWVLLCDPEDVKQVFTADPRRLGVGEANTLLGPVLGPRSVMLLAEPEHMARRKLMLPQFHGRNVMSSCGEMIAEVARNAVADWPLHRPFELWPRMQAITLQAIMRVVFGEPQSDSLRHLGELLGDLTERMNDPRKLSLLAVLGPRSMIDDPEFRGAMERVETAVLEEVRSRRAQPAPLGESASAPSSSPASSLAASSSSASSASASASPSSASSVPERNDIVSMLADARYEDGSPMSAQDLRDELITLLLDGPTSTSLAWVFERLLRHPDKLARLRAEIDQGEGEAYMDAVLKETLRLCPPVPLVVRELLEPMRLGRHELSAGTMVAPCVHLIHRREDVYPHPRRFVPERFLEQPAGTYTWIPFGGGVRRCLAASFALLEMKSVVRAVLEEVEMRPAQSRSEQVRKSAISYSPGRRGLVLITRRRTPGVPRPSQTAPGARRAGAIA